MQASANTSPAPVDVRELLAGSGPFGPDDVRTIADALGTNPATHRELRLTVQELQAAADRSPAASVRLGVGLYLLGRSSEAVAALKSGDGSALALFALGLAQAALGGTDEARGSFEAARSAGYPAAACTAAIANVLRAAGRLEEATSVLNAAGSDEIDSAEVLAARGAVGVESAAPLEEVLATLEKAVAADSGQPLALFCLGVLHDRMGNDDEAIESYQRSLQRYPATVGGLINLGLLYEDRDEFSKAQECYRRILDGLPFDAPGREEAVARARLFMKDSAASGDRLLDEQEQRQRDRLEQIMTLPVSDFELSVRSRNCLAKMGIQTLGDLARTSEAEVLASKNFGETSLVEIKEMLASKGLSLGQFAEPTATAEPLPSFAEPVEEETEIHGLPVTELNLSVRARKCTTKLGITTIGELVRRTGEDLMECKNFGVTSLNEVRERLAERGLKLRGE
jgi:DNA-directed RNA polymerase subunit alpha